MRISESRRKRLDFYERMRGCWQRGISRSINFLASIQDAIDGYVEPKVDAFYRTISKMEMVVAKTETTTEEVE